MAIATGLVYGLRIGVGVWCAEATRMTRTRWGTDCCMARGSGLDECVVVVTGASSGVGVAIAHELARRRAAIALAARTEDALKIVADQCRALGGRPLVIPTDGTDPASVERLAAETVAEFGHIDAWINNAAVSAVGLFEEVPLAEFRRVIEVNLLGFAYGMRAAFPHLRAAGGGVLVNNASVLAEAAMPYQSAYNAAKHAIRGLTDTIRQELRVTGQRDIALCTVLPATIDTPFFEHAANRTGRALRPPPPVYPPATVARTVVRLLRHPRREAYVGSAARLLGLQWRVAPGLTERLLGWYAARAQLAPEAAAPSSGIVFVPDSQAAAEGGWRSSSRMLRTTAMIGLVAGTIAAVVRRLPRRRSERPLDRADRSARPTAPLQRTERS
jgi:NAD(P)-dependent dehydrogenase (short-subunit alcohol dehydrogenase family)